MERRRTSFAIACLVPLVVSAPACGDEPEAGGELVVGVQAEELGALVGDVVIDTTLDGAVVGEERVPAGGGLPKEVVVRGRVGARVDVKVHAAVANGTAPLVSRTATALLPRERRLLRVQLQPSCAALPTALAGAPILCAAPQTCVLGGCAPSEVTAEALEDYTPEWAKNPPDICKPARPGPPELVLGTGMTDYGALADGQTLALERGPQGGHHLWIAARMRNLRQAGSITTVRGKVVDDPSLKVPDAAFVFSFERDEGSYCKLWGLRFQVDSGTNDLRNAYKAYLGKKMEITVEVVDSSGARATATRTVQVAPQLLCPDGTTGCDGS